MSYYKALGLRKEPFSTSPDPEFFYNSISHNTALKRLEIAIRLRRGLSVILGDVGTGKTTLSRTLLQAFADENDFIFHLILDPGFKTEYQFLFNLIKVFGIQEPQLKTAVEFREEIERYLFQKSIEEGKTIVLLIDEGQKLNFENLEVLRTLLNYETNEHKLLQLVILAQNELLPRIKRMNNFLDRVALMFSIDPLSESETKEMIEFRLKQAGFSKLNPLFSDEAVRLIYENTLGYPRKIAMLCHSALERVIMRGEASINEGIIMDLVADNVSV